MNEAVNITQHGGTVRLTMSAQVAGNLGALQKGLKSLAERIGHPSCATGCDILHLGMEREFTVSGAGEHEALNPQPLPPGHHAITESNPMPGRQVSVAIPDRVSRDINLLTRA